MGVPTQPTGSPLRAKKMLSVGLEITWKIRSKARVNRVTYLYPGSISTLTLLIGARVLLEKLNTQSSLLLLLLGLSLSRSKNLTQANLSNFFFFFLLFFLILVFDNASCEPTSGAPAGNARSLAAVTKSTICQSLFICITAVSY